jgi:hypothetical protein
MDIEIAIKAGRKVFGVAGMVKWKDYKEMVVEAVYDSTLLSREGLVEELVEKTDDALRQLMGEDMPAKSQAQRKYMAMVEHGVIPAPKGLSKKEASEFASTPEKGLPKKVVKKGK